MTTPDGELAVAVRISEHDGALAGVMRTPEQPGNGLIPLNITEASTTRLTFTAPGLAGSFTGEWSAAEAAWSGAWSQSGYHLALVLRRASAAVHVVKGLDGLWEAGVQREGHVFHLRLRVITTADGTSARFDAPDSGEADLPVAELAREGDKVGFRGRLSGDPSWTALQPQLLKRIS